MPWASAANSKFMYERMTSDSRDLPGSTLRDHLGLPRKASRYAPRDAVQQQSDAAEAHA